MTMAQIGPILPPDWKAAESQDQGGSCEEDKADKGEDDREDTASPDAYGPALPPDMATNSDRSSSDDDGEEEEEEAVGPVPEAEADSSMGYEYRLHRLRQTKAEEEEIKQRKRAREEWMTELPSKLSKSYGLSARAFKQHSVPSSGDTTAWTATPDERQRQQHRTEDVDEEALLKKAAAKRDKKFDIEVAKLSDQRSNVPLVDVHAKKQKLDEEEGTKQQRRPFDRDKDLKIVNLSSPSERKAMIDKASQLTSRFGHGSSQKYL